MKTLATEFKALREYQELSLKDLAERSGLQQASPWKVENNKTVKGATLHAMIVDGLQYATSSKEYQQLVALWAESHGLIVENRAKLKPSSARASKEASIAKTLADCPARDINALEQALSDTEPRGALLCLARYYTKK